MRVLALAGDDAELRSAALIRGLVASGATVAALSLGADDPAEDGSEFVAAHGALWPNACFWLEFATGRPLGTSLPDGAFDFLVAIVPDGMSPPRGIAGHAAGLLEAAALPVVRDRFGRPFLSAPVPGLPALPARAAEPRGEKLGVGILGHERYHRDIYPAVLAALGDAAERTGLAVTPLFPDPAGIPAETLLPLDGLILPGGSDLTQVPGQIAVAAAAFDRRLPLFGLCLGMQTMTTALLRRNGWPAATLEEFAGPGAERSFVRLRDAAGQPRHRLGEERLQAAAGSRLASFLPGSAAVRTNHRYALAAEAAAALPAGVLVHRGAHGIADAVEQTEETFCIGLQGHPELGCEPALRALWDGFLASVSGFAAARSSISPREPIRPDGNREAVQGSDLP
jgi:Glutamine amidotransferase class-I